MVEIYDSRFIYLGAIYDVWMYFYGVYVYIYISWVFKPTDIPGSEILQQIMLLVWSLFANCRNCRIYWQI